MGTRITRWTDTAGYVFALVVALDLTDGYFHLSIREVDRKYFGFRIGSRIFRMVAVPFGWNHAPRLFTSLMQPVVQEMRAPGSGSY